METRKRITVSEPCRSYINNKPELGSTLQMKIPFGKPNKDPFAVPPEDYIGTLFRCRKGTKPCRMGCSIDDQIIFDFALIDKHGIDEGYIAHSPRCTKCTRSLHSMRHFLEQWLGDKLYDHLDSKFNVELDELIGRKADIRITPFHVEGYKNPYAIVEGAYERGTLID